MDGDLQSDECFIIMSGTSQYFKDCVLNTTFYPEHFSSLPSHLKMKIFFVRLIAFSSLIGIVDICWNRFVPAYPVPHAWAIILIFFLITAVFHYVLTKNKDARPQVIVRYYMSGTVLRLFLYILILLLYRLIEKPTLVPFAVAFVLHYFLFTAFEVAALMKQFRTPSNVTPSNNK
jgi:hypothetical protein